MLNEDTELRVKSASDKLNNKFPSFFKLDSAHIPHATLLHGDVNDEDLEKIIYSVENVVSSIKSISVIPQDLRRGFMFPTLLGVYFKDESEILTIRQKVLDRVNKYLSNLSPNLAPHITITRLKKDGDVENAMSEVKSLLLRRKYVFPSVGVCKIGENGTCARIIKSILFSS